MEEIHLEIRYCERQLSNSPKKLTLSFLLNTIYFNVQNHQKQKEPETSD